MLSNMCCYYWRAETPIIRELAWVKLSPFLIIQIVTVDGNSTEI